MTPLPHFPVMTPLGPAVCVGILADLDDPEWVTWILATGEPWFWRNPSIRLRRNVTNGLRASAPFDKINATVMKQIERYKQNGWLPADYSPEHPESWPL